MHNDDFIAWAKVVDENDEPQALVEVIRGLLSELEARELHHFEAEQALANIKAYINESEFYADELDPDDILRMIPEDI